MKTTSLVVAAAIVACSSATLTQAEDAKYVDELNVKSATELLHEAFLSGVQKGATVSGEALVNDVAKALLSSFLNSYIPGSASLLGLSGSDGLAALQQVIIERLNLMSGQLSVRLDQIDNAPRREFHINAITSFSSGLDSLNQYRSSSTLDQKFVKIGSLEQALLQFANATNYIETYSTEDPHEASFLLWQLHATALSLYIGAAQEYQRLSAVAGARGQSAADLESLVLNMTDLQRQSLDNQIVTNFRNSIAEKANRAFAFYANMGNSIPNTAGRRGAANGWNQVENVVDTWFTYVAHSSACWDTGRDINWRSNYKTSQSYSQQCNCNDIHWFKQPSAPCGGTAGTILWYYNAHPPTAACLNLKDPSQDNETCNRYEVVDMGQRGTDGWASIFGSFDNMTAWFPAADKVPDEHWKRVYLSYLTRTYPPVVAVLDRLWTVAGNAGTRPRNGLDLELDFTVQASVLDPIDLAPAVQKARETIDFDRFAGHSTALLLAYM